MLKLLVFPILAILAGCAGSGPRYAQVAERLADAPATDARIVFFRTRDSALYIARRATVSLNGNKVGGTAYGGFHYHDIAPGSHRLKADMWDAPGKCELSLTVEPGQIYYFQVDPRLESFWAFSSGDFATTLAGGGAISVLSGLGTSAAESYGKECGGAFRLYPVDAETAKAKLNDLRLSE